MVFIAAIDGVAPEHHLKSEHSLFTVNFATEKGVQLQEAPFSAYTQQLTHKTDYSATHKLGADMRESGVEAFEYLSARSKEEGVCVALFTRDVFTQQKPETIEHWLCEAGVNGVTFTTVGKGAFYFPSESFQLEGEVPFPA